MKPSHILSEETVPHKDILVGYYCEAVVKPPPILSEENVPHKDITVWILLWSSSEVASNHLWSNRSLQGYYRVNITLKLQWNCLQFSLKKRFLARILQCGYYCKAAVKPPPILSEETVPCKEITVWILLWSWSGTASNPFWRNCSSQGYYSVDIKVKLQWSRLRSSLKKRFLVRILE